VNKEYSDTRDFAVVASRSGMYSVEFACEWPSRMSASQTPSHRNDHSMGVSSPPRVGRIVLSRCTPKQANLTKPVIIYEEESEFPPHQAHD